MNKNVTDKELVENVNAHVGRLSQRLSLEQENVTIEKEKIDPKYKEEDQIALSQVNEALKSDIFKKKLCGGLTNLSSDISELTKPLVKILLPVSAIDKGITLLGQTWTIGTFPISIIGVSILALYLARFGIGYYCNDQS